MKSNLVFIVALSHYASSLLAETHSIIIFKKFAIFFQIKKK